MLAVIAPTAAFAQVGTPSGGGDTISWSISASGHTSVELRVSCADDTTVSKTFRGGQPVTLSIRDFAGNRVPNGPCTYDMYTVPFIPSGVAKQLANARAAGDEKAASKILKSAGVTSSYDSGSLYVQDNSFVTLGGTEGNAARTPSTNAADDNPTAGSPGAGTRRGAAGRFQPGTEDQVIPDDLIVQGSGCFGFDCVNNESFGFDTIRMKENNTRIKFEDTSSTAGFPTNDWQLTANDSASGGASKFSVEDITGAKVPMTITAGASTNSIFVDSTGRVGFRTSTPVLDLHVATSNTPAIRLEQNNSGGFTAQTWDIGANEANFFVRDVTGGSKLSLRIRPGAPTSSVDISADGDVGIGTASPATKLHVAGTLATDGNTGIGTTSPLTKLHVFDSGNSANLKIGNQTASNAGSSLNVHFDTAGYGEIFSFNHSTSTALPTVVTVGNFGVGTTAPSSKLHVSGGDVRVTGGSFIDDGVTLLAPDYVFEPDYKLMTIDDVASFIKQNKHLPNVPSALEIKKSGLNMSQFSMRLLEKVEELTLYTIEQDQLLDTLKTQNAELQKRLDAIEQQLSKNN